MTKIIIGIGFLLSFIVGGAFGFGIQSFSSETEMMPPTPSAYVALLDTEIRGIDSKTIEGYLNGAGLGLALPAELNGYPGPRHILDLADELSLTSDQQAQVQALFDQMKPQAITLGEEILAAEGNLEQAFREQTIQETDLSTQLTALGNLQSQLRFVHLRTHLATIDILSQHQIAQYNGLRGYEAMPADHQDHHP